MPTITANTCSTAGKTSRFSLALFGEPQVCASCGRPMEFSRAWQRIAVAVEIMLSFAAVVLLVRGSLFAGLSCIAAVGVVQVGLWLLAPIQHQSPTSVSRRNRFYLLCTIALLVFASWLLLHNAL
jgi:hypothetical protein